MLRPSESPAARRLRRAALAAVVANIAIVLTGGTVRLTGSGLGCPDWPRCEGTRVVPRPGGEAAWHQAIEFGNRLLTFVVLAAVIAVVVAARRLDPSRPTLVRLAWLLPAGVVVQAVLGGVTVLTGLSPLWVAAHFLLSMALIAVAVVVHDLAGSGRPPEPLPALRWLTTTVLAVAGVVLALGTLVTAAGPHAGDPGTPRLGIDIRLAALAHADAVWVLLGLTAATVVVAHALAAPGVRAGALVLLGLELVQGGIGYTQYALGIPAGLVALHLLGAALVWVAAVRLRARTRAP